MSKSIKKNYMYNLIYNILLIVSPLIVTPYVSRILKPDGIGAYQYTNAIVTVFILIASLGTNMYAQREIAYYQNNIEKRSKIFKSIFIIRLISSFIVTIIYIPIMFLNETYKYLYLVQYILIISNVFNITWLYQGLEDFKKTATRGLIVKIISIFSIFVFVKTKNDLVLYAFINAMANLISSLYLWLYIKKIIIPVKLNIKDITQHIKPVILLFLPVAAIYVYTYVDKIILGMLSTTEQVGFYSQSENLVKIVMTTLTSLGTVLLPRISKLLGQKKWDEVKNEVNNSIKFVIMLGLPMVFGLILTSSLFVPWFFGDEYLPCIFLIQLLSFLIVIIGLSSVTGQAILIPLNKQKEYTITIAIGAVLNVLLNIMLIPKYGAIGASLATLAAEMIVNITQQILVFKILKLRFIDVLNSNIKSIISTLVMILILLIIKPYFNVSILSTLIYSLLGIIIYIVTLTILNEDYIYTICNLTKNNK